MSNAASITQHNKLYSMIFMLIASAFIAGTTLCAKALGRPLLGDPLHPLQISHGRFMFAFLAIALCSMIMGLKIHKPNWRIHLARTTSGWAGVSLMFAAVAYIPLSDATAISFLNPVFAMGFAILLLGERVGPIRWIAAGIALCGAMILLRPGGDSFQPLAMLALLAAVIMGFEITLIKFLSGREPPLQILLINNTMGLCIATIAVSSVWIMPTPPQWVILICIGLLMATAQACFIQAMRFAEASFAAPFSYTTLVFATLYDFGLFRAIPDSISILGAAIILVGALVLAWREGRLSKKMP